MKQLDEFLPRLNGYVPGCPHPVALQALRDACIDLCERSSVVQEITEPIALEEGQGTYDVPLGVGLTLHRVLKAWHGKHPIVVPALNEVKSLPPLDGEGGTGQPQLAMPLDKDSITLHPAPDQESTVAPLRMQIAVKPTRDANAVPDVLFDDWVEVVVFGAVARLASQVGTPYSNIDLAAMGSVGFTNGVGRAKKAAAKGKTRSDLRMRGRTFAHSSYTIGGVR